ncbi:hypothetical protein DENSPDRAFT_833820 [Dentipellis sp. KUC8613]|nr:hypothetical protein DENSPDRAFT_833820 [Dentipellis sp. KUC8613]
MTAPQVLTLSTLAELFSINGAYYIGFSFLFGMSLWVTFFGGVIAFRALPRHQFGALQHRTFPVYFNISIGLSSALLALWARANPGITARVTSFQDADVAQAYALGTVLAGQALNSFVIGPLTSKCMFARHKLEKEEGKAYNDPDVSEEMKALNRQFGRLHGWSSLANLLSFFALGFHGLWLGNFGTKVN